MLASVVLCVVGSCSVDSGKSLFECLVNYNCITPQGPCRKTSEQISKPSPKILFIHHILHSYLQDKVHLLVRPRLRVFPFHFQYTDFSFDCSPVQGTSWHTSLTSDIGKDRCNQICERSRKSPAERSGFNPGADTFNFSASDKLRLCFHISCGAFFRSELSFQHSELRSERRRLRDRAHAISFLFHVDVGDIKNHMILLFLATS